MALLLIAGAATPAHAVPAAAKTSSTCFPKHASGLHRTGTVRVYVRNGYTTACHLPTGRRTELGDAPREGPGVVAVDHIRIAGRYVAYQLYFSRERFESYFHVLDSRTGRIRTVRAEQDSGNWNIDAPGRISDVVLNSRGVGAYILRDGQWSDPPGSEVHIVNKAGNRVVDAGAGIAPHSLALSDGGTLYWTADGVPRSTPLK